MIDLVDWSGAVGGWLWLALLVVPWRPWSTAERLDHAAPQDRLGGAHGLTVLIPARNEAGTIAATLAALAGQGDPALPVIVIDDQSEDETAAVARRAAAAAGLTAVTVISGAPLPEGWTGKLWALEQGRGHARTPLLLLLDADITLAPGVAETLRARLEQDGLGLISVMARLRMATMWEKLLIPPFVYFFKLLYPFRLNNGRCRAVAAAAGGCLLIRADILAAIGGFTAFKTALIDDCTLAALVKRRGYRIWLGLSRLVVSHRPYGGLAAIWAMVARTAYTQLHYRFTLLLLCTVVMATLFWAPVIGVAFGDSPWHRLSAAAGTMAMAVSIVPLLRYYGLNAAWAATLPVSGTLFLMMTWHSAVRYGFGRRSKWKGRSYVA